MHPLRQTSFPAVIAGGGDGELAQLERAGSFSVASDAGSVTGSFTGSLGDGMFGQAGQAQAQSQGKKRGRKRKADRDRDDAASSVHGRSTRVGSADVDGGSVRGAGGRSTRDGGRSGRGGSAGVGADEGDEDDDLDDEGGELLGGEEGPGDTEAEKKNLA